MPVFNRRTAVAMLAATLLMLTTGCTVGLSGSARPVSNGGGALQHALGDIRTVDGCSLLDNKDFAGLGHSAELTDRSPGYGWCIANLNVYGKGKSILDPKKPETIGSYSVETTLYKALHTEKDYRKVNQNKGHFSKHEVRGLEVFKGKTHPYRDKKSYTCQRGITVGDYTLAIKATPPMRMRLDVCRVADAAMNGAISTLQQGRIKRIALAKGSPARHDLCRRFDRPSKQVLGRNAKPNSGSALFACRWTTASRTGGEVGIQSNEWPPSIARDKKYGFKKTTVNKRKAYCLKSKEKGIASGMCIIQYGDSPFHGEFTTLTVSAFQQHSADISKRLGKYTKAVLAAIPG